MSPASRHVSSKAAKAGTSSMMGGVIKYSRVRGRGMCSVIRPYVMRLPEQSSVRDALSPRASCWLEIFQALYQHATGGVKNLPRNLDKRRRNDRRRNYHRMCTQKSRCLRPACRPVSRCRTAHNSGASPTRCLACARSSADGRDRLRQHRIKGLIRLLGRKTFTEAARETRNHSSVLRQHLI